MDIAKYVGLFLVKNEYCFLPGLGSLQVEKKPAVYDKESQRMSAPVYWVKHIPSGGSIDDSFANFIANNERISIAHASNYLKDFCAQAKMDLKEGKEVVIPAIGKFVSDANGVIQFITDPHLQIEGRSIPVFKNSPAVEKRKEEAISNIIERTTIREPKADEAIEYKAPSVNWGKIILLIVIILIVLGGIGYLVWYMSNSGNSTTTDKELIDSAALYPPNDTATQQKETHTDTATTPTSPAETQPIVADNGQIAYKVILHQYADIEKAKARANRLVSYGNKVEVFTRDSSEYFVVMPMQTVPGDTTKVVDSLRRLFNPGGKVEIAY